MRSRSRLYLLAIAFFLVASCAPKPTPQLQPGPTETATASPTPTPTPLPAAQASDTPTPTPTPTPSPQALDTPTPEPSSACVGLSGYLEVQILIAPSDAVGLEPLAVGQLPFAVDGSTSPYPLSGAATLSYQDTLVENWGTYDVRFDADVTVDGTCRDANQGASLEMVVTMDAEQVLTVTVDGTSSEFPWAGTHTREFVLPAETGATAQGEGWAFVLYLD